MGTESDVVLFEEMYMRKVSTVRGETMAIRVHRD